MAKKTPHLPVQGTSLFDRTIGIPYSKGGSAKLTGRGRPAGRFTRGGFNFGGGSNR